MVWGNIGALRIGGLTAVGSGDIVSCVVVVLC